MVGAQLAGTAPKKGTTQVEAGQDGEHDLQAEPGFLLGLLLGSLIGGGHKGYGYGGGYGGYGGYPAYGYGGYKHKYYKYGK